MKSSRLITSIGLAAVLTGCATQDWEPETTVLSGVKGLTVKLEVADDGKGNEVLINKNLKSRGCGKFPDEDKYRKGCIVAQRGEMVKVEFMLSGTPGWYFTAFQVCSVGGENPQKPADYADCRLTVEQRADLLVLTSSGIAVPNENGRVDIPSSGPGLQQFELRDLNWLKGVYFYGVQACTGTGGGQRCLWTDPGLENNGLGNN
jgi:hypothetical protein